MRLPAALRSPVAVLAGTRAVLERDFVVLTSQRRFVVLRTLVVVATALIVGATLLSIRSDQPGDFGQATLFAIAMAVPALVLLLGPPLAASCIASERAVGTLDLVLAAPVTPASFVLAKFISRLATILVLVFATLPIASLALVYGGVSPELLFEVYLLATAFGVFGVAAGVVASAFSRRVAAAVLRAYALAVLAPVLWIVGVQVAGEVAARNGYRGAIPSFERLIEPSPFGAWFRVLEACGSTGGATLVVRGAALIMLALAGVALLAAAWRIAREAGFRTASGKVRRPRRIRLPLGRPAFARAVRGSLLSRPTRNTFLFSAAVLVAWGLAVWGILEEGSDSDSDWLHLSVLIGLSSVLVLGTLSGTSSHVAEQRQQGSLPLLLSTPVTPQDVVHDGFAAAYGNVFPFLVLGAGHAAVAVVVGPLIHEAGLAWFAATIVYIGLAAAVGLRVSVTASTAGRAVLRTFAIFLGGSLLIGVLGLLFALVARDMDAGAMFWFGAAPVVTFIGAPAGTLGTVTSTGGDDATALAGMGLWLVAHAAAIPVLLAAATRRLAAERE